MGAGCYYTSNIDNERTFWVDIPQVSEEEFEEYKADYLADFGEECQESLETFSYESQLLFLDCLKCSIESICDSKKFASWYFDREAMTIESGLLIIRLEYTYYGDGLVFNFDLVDESLKNLAKHNYKFALKNWIEALKKEGFTLSMATSGYTATEI